MYQWVVKIKRSHHLLKLTESQIINFHGKIKMSQNLSKNGKIPQNMTLISFQYLEIRINL